MMDCREIERAAAVLKTLPFRLDYTDFGRWPLATGLSIFRDASRAARIWRSNSNMMSIDML
jgi:hypothetical protein